LKSRSPTSGKTLRSRPTMPPTKAFRATKSENCAAFARNPSVGELLTEASAQRRGD
jgi:hypothetical protein